MVLDFPENEIGRKFTGKYPFSLSLNRNLLDFYATFPLCDLSVYFRAEPSKTFTNSMDKIVKIHLKGKSRPEQIAWLLDLVQQVFIHKPDVEVHKTEVYYFPEETAFYPYADCEDLSVFLSWLICRYVTSEVLVLYYPTHVAIAVECFEGREVFKFRNKEYLICDPSYRGAVPGTLLFIVLFYFRFLPQGIGQKRISGRSVSVQFSMVESPLTPEGEGSSLKEHYVSSLQIADLDSLPDDVPIRPNSVAVIIGVEQYDFIPVAPYAARDAELVSRYFKALLGLERVIVHKNKDVSGFFFENLFNAEEGELARVIEKGKTDLYVYYSGHGIPAADGGDVYMLPVDSKMRLIEKQGYSLNTLFEQLDKLQAKSTTVFIDACFSGLGKYSQ